jgi:hypothetical protein
MTTTMGFGWAYTLLGGICILLLPLMLLEMKIGPKCRLIRKTAEDAKVATSVGLPDVEA